MLRTRTYRSGWLLLGGTVFGIYFGLGLLYFETFDFAEQGSFWMRLPVFLLLAMACSGLGFLLFFRTRRQSLYRRNFSLLGFPVLVFSMVGVLLTLYAAGVGKDEFSMVLMSRIGFNLLLVGLLPLVAALVYLQGKPITNDPSDHNREESEDIVGSQERAEQPVFSLDTGPGGEGFEVYREDLIMVEAADNYCKFHCNVNAQRKVRTFRIAMKEVARMLENEKQFSRCHRSFLINTALLDDIVGVSQAYKLKLRGIEELVPVSRSFDIAPLRELLPQFRG